MFNKRDEASGETGNSNHGDSTSASYDRPSDPGPSSNVTRRDVAVIGASIRINGDLQGDEDLLIQGQVHGTVQLKNNALTVGEQGSLQANIYAKTITVEGTMKGDLYGQESVSVRASAQVSGNIVSPRVSLADGAQFKGSIEMDPDALNDVFKNSKAASAGSTGKSSASGGSGGTSATDDKADAKRQDKSVASSST